MTPKVRELWVIPTIISLGTGILLLPVGAFLTGSTIRSPFTAAGILAVLRLPVPLWGVSLFAGATIFATLWPRDRAEARTHSEAPISHSEGNNAPVAAFKAALPESESGSAQPSSHALSKAQVDSPDRLKGEDLVFHSADDFDVRFSKVEAEGVRGIQVSIENYRLRSLNGTTTDLIDACSFDKRHQAFREPVVSGLKFYRQTPIRPSSSGNTCLLIRKAPQWPGLVSGENSLVYQLPWPEKDLATVQKWRLRVKVFASESSAIQALPPTNLTSVEVEVIVLWNKEHNEFSFE